MSRFDRLKQHHADAVGLQADRNAPPGFHHATGTTFFRDHLVPDTPAGAGHLVSYDELARAHVAPSRVAAPPIEDLNMDTPREPHGSTFFRPQQASDTEALGRHHHHPRHRHRQPRHDPRL